MSTRLSFPLFASLDDGADTPVWFGSTELCQRLGLTARQLQWWDEQGLLPARHEGHKRLYSGRDAVLAGVIGTLRKAGLGQARLQTALRTLTIPDGRWNCCPATWWWTGSRGGARRCRMSGKPSSV
jgi:hypothetical protein